MSRRKVNKKKSYNLNELRQLYSGFNSGAKLDFHEYGIVSNNEIVAIYREFIDRCLKEDISQVTIITGKGKVVRPSIKRLLSKDKHVAEFSVASSFNGGLGAFEVKLKTTGLGMRPSIS